MSAPRLGFVGVGWIGAMRLGAVAASGRGVIAAVCDADGDRAREAAARYGGVPAFTVYEDMLARADAMRLDGVVIATPNALHAPQTIAALERGLAVFCQKPLALGAVEARTVVEAARRADRLLEVDYSYRHTDGARALRRTVLAGELGRVFAVESVFHNAYGPDKAWCRDPALAGGGALVDLGVHQIDLPLWLLGGAGSRDASARSARPDAAAVAQRSGAAHGVGPAGVHGRAYQAGEPLDRVGIDDFAVAQLELDDGARVHIAVSWNAHAGADCVIRTTLFGTRGGAEIRNIDGSFYDFETIRFDGRTRTVIGRESREWLGRGIVAWVERLAVSPRYDPGIAGSVRVAEVVDAVYGAGAAAGRTLAAAQGGGGAP